MARTEVSSVIRDILDAFSNGLQIVKGSGRRHKRRNSETSNDVVHERRVQESLTTRPQEIKRAYDQAVVRHGKSFEVGDSASQNGLAQVLLRLNTGLIKLLNQALSSDKNSRSKSRNGIFSLSEAAAIDTLSAMSELSVRLLSSSRIDLTLPPPGKREHKPNVKKVRSHSQSGSSDCRRPPPTPLLQHGGWVRSKTDPSVVSVVAAPRARKVEPKRVSRAHSHSVSELGLIQTANERSPPPRYSQVEQKPLPVTQHLRSHSEATDLRQTHPELTRHPSMYLVPSEFFKAFPQAVAYQTELGSDKIAPRRPPKVPLQQPEDTLPRRQPPLASTEGIRIRPPSMMTFMTASTKIGEIPAHRLPDRDLTPTQQQAIPMPYVVPDMLEPKKKGGRGLRFWKKDRQPTSAQDIAA